MIRQLPKEVADRMRIEGGIVAECNWNDKMFHLALMDVMGIVTHIWATSIDKMEMIQLPKGEIQDCAFIHYEFYLQDGCELHFLFETSVSNWGELTVRAEHIT